MLPSIKMASSASKYAEGFAPATMKTPYVFEGKIKDAAQAATEGKDVGPTPTPSYTSYSSYSS